MLYFIYIDTYTDQYIYREMKHGTHTYIYTSHNANRQYFYHIKNLILARGNEWLKSYSIN